MRKVSFSLLMIGVVLISFAAVPSNATEAKLNKAGVAEKKENEQEAKRRAELANTEWKVTLYTTKPTDKDAENGVLVFENNTMTFKNFKKFSLEPIGYTLTTYADSNKGTLETYKVTKDGNIGLRADWEAHVMNGIISEQTDGGKSSKVWRFTSVNQVEPIAKAEQASTQAEAVNSPEKTLVSLDKAKP